MATAAIRPGGPFPGSGNQPMRPGGRRPDVALVLHEFGSGGVERVGCLLLNGFAGRELEVEAVVVRPDGANAGLLSGDVGVRVLGDATARLGRGLGLLGAIPRLAGYLRRARPRVFLSPGNHTHVVATIAHWLSGSDSQLVLKITNPLLKSEHGLLARALRRAFYGWACRRAAAILVLSPHGYRQASEVGHSMLGRTVFVHNPYVTERGLPDPRHTPRPAPPMIVAVGRLTRQKNHALLLHALARIRMMPWRLVLLGEGPLEPELRRLAAKLGLADRVEFAGFVPDPTPYYDAAQVMALPSRWEDLPAVAIEALAIGLPVVATACSDALVTLVAGAEVGTLVRPGDAAALADAIAAEVSSPRRRVPFAGAAAYRIEAGVEDHLRVLRPLLDSSSPTRVTSSVTGASQPVAA